MSEDRDRKTESNTTEGETANSERQPAAVRTEPVADAPQEEKPGWGKRWLARLFPIERPVPRATRPNFKNRGGQLAAWVALGFVAFILCIYLASTSNTEIERQNQEREAHQPTARPSPPVAGAPVEKQLAPITEPQSSGGGESDLGKKGSEKVVTPEEVLQTADPEAVANSPQKQAEYWRKKALFWKQQAEGKLTDTASGGAVKQGPKAYDEFEKDIQRFLAEKERNTAGGPKATGHDLADIEGDFSKVPDIDSPDFNKAGAALAASGKTSAGAPEERSKIGEKSDRSPAAQNDPKANPLDAKSVVFRREERKTPAANAVSVSGEGATKTLPLATKIKARLQASVSTAVDLPAVAIIEHNYVHDGEVMIPAGSKAFGRLTQANRNGTVGMVFDSILTPENKTIKINGSAQSLNGLGPLRGNVSGKSTGKRILARTLGGVGTVGALVAGHPGGVFSSNAYSYGDYMRGQLAYGIAGETNRALSSLDREDLQVTVPANTRFEIILMSTVKITETGE